MLQIGKKTQKQQLWSLSVENYYSNILKNVVIKEPYIQQGVRDEGKPSGTNC